MNERLLPGETRRSNEDLDDFQSWKSKEESKLGQSGI